MFSENDFRAQNKQLKLKTYPMDRNNVMLLKLESFKYVTSLNLNMGCYNIQLSEYSSRLCMIILTWVKYRYERQPMGLSNSPDIFQEKMNHLFQGF